MEAFKCDKCGKCCENLNLSADYDDLNDGMGVCIYYDRETHLCTIYENRPDKCNVIKSYKSLMDKMSIDEYFELNYMSCKILKGGV